MDLRMTSFIGHVPASKSILNRALILHSFEPDLKIYGVSDSDDVVKMKAGIKALKDQAMIDCGEGGTVLRFLALRASREKGRHKLTGSARLINRPQEELVKILSQLDVTAKFAKNSLTIESDGWRPRLKTGFASEESCKRPASAPFSIRIGIIAWRWLRA